MVNNKIFTSKDFLIEYIFAKKTKARLSGPPETATIKFLLIFKISQIFYKFVDFLIF